MSIQGIGSDIVEVERMSSKIKREKFVESVFTEKEISYCQKQARPAEHFAARFAAKEAYMKALGEGWTENANFKEIEVLKMDSGAPYIELHGKTLSFFNSSQLSKAFVSLSHTDKSALAFILIEKG